MLYRLGRYEEALESVEKGLSFEDKDEHDSLVGLRGQIFAAMGKHIEALKDFEKVLDVKDWLADDPPLFFEAAKSLEALGRYEDALAHLNCFLPDENEDDEGYEDALELKDGLLAKLGGT